MDIKSIEGTGLIGKKVRIDASFTYAAKDVVRGTNGYRRFECLWLKAWIITKIIILRKLNSFI